MNATPALPVRGFLLHLTHYDPTWFRRKGREQPFDLDLGLAAIDTMAAVGMNLLVIDCADGVAYDSHPELARPYTVPMDHLRELVARAADRGIEVVPKLNFSHSTIHHHNDWFRPYNALFDDEEYWQHGFELIDELIAECRPPRFFHIGMDEDHDRAHSQYIAAIERLHAGLAERGLRTIIWNDSCYGGRALVHAEKSLAAEAVIPRDIVQVPWHYGAAQPAVVQRLIDEGFEVWGAPGRDHEQVAAWRDDLVRAGGQGMLLTFWQPCRPRNRTTMLELLRTNGPILSGD